ncbi:hypothetical protein GOV12_06965 [Candidatus Pacearchaeota archaeon]|nr:hypothetical protein [Candidatus Pacearchaeota archaeon]
MVMKLKKENKQTTIRIFKTTVEKLKFCDIGVKADDYDTLILKLYKFYEDSKKKK